MENSLKLKLEETLPLLQKLIRENNIIKVSSRYEHHAFGNICGRINENISVFIGQDWKGRLAFVDLGCSCNREIGIIWEDACYKNKNELTDFLARYTDASVLMPYYHNFLKTQMELFEPTNKQPYFVDEIFCVKEIIPACTDLNEIDDD